MRQKSSYILRILSDYTFFRFYYIMDNLNISILKSPNLFYRFPFFFILFTKILKNFKKIKKMFAIVENICYNDI